MPLLEKVTVPVTKYATRNPRATFTLMMLIVIINMIILFHYTNAFVTTKGMGLTDLPFQNMKYQGHSGTVPNITVSFENIRKVRLLRDSLSYLLSLHHMTFQDTLTFVRVMDEFQKISSGTSGIPAAKTGRPEKDGSNHPGNTSTQPLKRIHQIFKNENQF